MLSLVCLAKRKRALRGRNLPRDSQAKGAPRACQASGVQGTPAAFFVPFGHSCHASKNPIRDGWVKTVAFARFSWSRFVVVALASWAESFLPSGVAEAVRRGGWIHLCAVTGHGGLNAAMCIPG